MKKNNLMKKMIGSLILPVTVFVVMYIFTHSNGKQYFGTWAMWETLIVDIAVASVMALGIGLQFNNGRFDFSGGSIMLLSAIIAGNTARIADNNILLFFIISILSSVLLSSIVGLIYVYGRLPIQVATIAMTLFYEGISTIIFNGGGVNIVGNMTLNRFSVYPNVLVPFLGAVFIYHVYNTYTVSGRQSELLANNQQSAVNIGINEEKNVLISFVVSGLIFGLATTIFASTGIRQAAFTPLASVQSLFSNILPVFIGLMLARFSGKTLGIIFGAVSLSILNYGLSIVFTAEMGSAITNIISGIFIFILNVAFSGEESIISRIKFKFANR